MLGGISVSSICENQPSMLLARFWLSKEFNEKILQRKGKRNKIMSMGCSSMISVAAFGPGDPGSNPDWFDVSNSNWKLSY